MIGDESLADFIISISRYEVSCFVSDKDVFTSRLVKRFDEGSLISTIVEAVRDVILKAEAAILHHLEKGIILIDFIEIKTNNIKIKQFNKSLVGKIKEDVEAKFGRKVISLFYLGEQDDYDLIQVLSTSKEDMQIISDAINRTEIEILEARPTIQFISRKIFLDYQNPHFTLMKFNFEFCEVGRVKNGTLVMYNLISDFSIKNLLAYLSEKFSLEEEDVLTILTYYSSHSKFERMQKYYEREDTDFHLKEFIEETRNLLSLHFEVKTNLVSLKQGILESFNLKSNTPFYFFYDYKFKDLNLHQFLNQPEENFGLENLGKWLKPKKGNKTAFFGALSNQVKKIFHLTS